MREAWRSYKSVEVLIRKVLRLPIHAQDLAGTALAASGLSPLPDLAKVLVEQVDEFLRDFRATARDVPDGSLILADAERLRNGAADFQKDVAGGLDPGRLAFEFREVDASWQRLARRTNRVAQGRTGPNIQQVERIGQTCATLHRLLGLPGYPPTVGSLASPR
jgi:hypothetical protein